jgi:hypothetical protein
VRTVNVSTTGDDHLEPDLQALSCNMALIFPFISSVISRRTFTMIAIVLLTASRAFAQDFRDHRARHIGPVVTARGTDLLVDKQPRFTVLVSYFDAMRASPAALERDFAFLKSKGIGGIRIFPLWINFAGTPNPQDKDATLLDADGRVRGAGTLESLCDRARQGGALRLRRRSVVESRNAVHVRRVHRRRISRRPLADDVRRWRGREWNLGDYLSHERSAFSHTSSSTCRTNATRRFPECT